MKLLWLLLFAMITGVAAAAEVVGQGRHVVDGDTFDMTTPGGLVKVRICGIDAPESGYPGSKEAWAKLSELVYGKTVRCIRVNAHPRTVCDGRSKSSNRDRIVAQCFVDGRDIAADLVQAGVACDWPKFSGGHYQRVPGAKVCTRS